MPLKTINFRRHEPPSYYKEELNMEIGWNINIETTNGVVGLWTSWLGDGLKIFYPLGAKISDDLIMKTLDVSMARPVKNNAFGTRMWARYYSKRLETDDGRVWIDHNCMHSYGHSMYTINEGVLENHYGGHSETNTIWTFEFNFSSPTEPDAPNNKRNYIQEYTDKFIKLLVEVAKTIGDIKAVNIDSELVLYTPETLGCQYVSSKVGTTKYCYVKSDNMEIMLRSGNSMVPWSTVIRYPINSEELTAQWLKDKLDSFDNSEDAFDPMPLVMHLAREAELYRNWN